MVFAKLRKRRGEITTRAARQIRLGIAAGELIYNLYLKKEISGAREALYKASKTPRRTYLATLHTLGKRMGCAPDKIVLR